MSDGTLRVRLNSAQYDILVGLFGDAASGLRDLYDTAVEIGGRGSGKSFLQGAFAKMVTDLPNALFLLTAPTIDQLDQSTLPGVLRAWDKLRFAEGRDWVKGRAPASWQVRPYKRLRAYNILTRRNGSHIIVDTSDNYEKHRGPEWDGIGADEVQGIDPRAFVIYAGGLRGQASALAGRNPKTLFTGNMPDDENLFERMKAEPRTMVRYVSSHVNAENLPTTYIDGMRSKMDALDYDREVLGLRRSRKGRLAVYAFDNLPWSMGGHLASLTIDPTAPLYLSWDFNSSGTRPMSTMVGQRFACIEGVFLSIEDPAVRAAAISRQWREDRDAIDGIVHEFVHEGMHVPEQCELIYDWLIGIGFTGELHVRGDHTGTHSRSTHSAESEFAIVRRMMSKGPWRWKGIKTRPTIRKKNRIAGYNNRLRAPDTKRRNMAIDPRCTRLIAAMLGLRWKENGVELEDNAYRDPVDAASYWPHADHPYYKEVKE